MCARTFLRANIWSKEKCRPANTMSESTTRYGFALLCALGMVAILFGTVLEIARFRRHARQAARLVSSNAIASNGIAGDSIVGDAIGNASLISPRQFRLRLISAALWMLILGALFYAVTKLWPARHTSTPTLEEIDQARRFAMTLICAFMGMFVAFGLLVWDMMQLARERQAQTARFHQGLAELARTEAARLETRQQNTSAASPDNAPFLAQNEPRSSIDDGLSNSSSES